MPQTTAPRIRDRINLLHETPGLPFSDLLNPCMVAEALSREEVRFRERFYTPLVTIWTFLTQVLSTDHSCRAAVNSSIRSWWSGPPKALPIFAVVGPQRSMSRVDLVMG